MNLLYFNYEQLKVLKNFQGEAPPHPPPPISKSPGPPLVPAPPAPTTVNSAGVWTITPADRARYDQIFNSLGPEANKIHGNKVVHDILCIFKDFELK